MNKKAIRTGLLFFVLGLIILPGWLLLSASLTTNDRPFYDVAWPAGVSSIQPGYFDDFNQAVARGDRNTCLDIATYPLPEHLLKAFERDTITQAAVRDENLFFTYTDSLFKRHRLPLDLDSLYGFMLWADRYVVLGQGDHDMSLVLESIGHFWLEEIGHHLAKYAGTWNTGRYSYRGRFIRDYLRTRNIQSKTSTSSLEKLFNYSIDGKWNYIFDRLWMGTSWKVKFALVLLSAFGLFCVGYTLYGIFFVFFNRNKSNPPSK